MCAMLADRAAWRRSAARRLGAALALVSTLAGLAPGDGLASGTPARSAAPRNADELRMCLGSGPIRLRTRSGHVEVSSTAWSDSGLAYSTREPGSRRTDSTLFLPWHELEAVETVARIPRAEGARVGTAIGFVTGVGVMILATRHRRGTAGDFVLPLAWLIGATPFALAGGLIGRHAAAFDDGWTTCARVRHAKDPALQP